MTDPDKPEPDIGLTAHYTAYVWKRLGLPHARWFATRKGALLYWTFFAAGEWTTRVLRDVPSMKQYLEYRHRLIDAEVDALDPDCVVELGAGLTSRTAMYAVDRGVAAIDIDLPPMVQARRSAISRADEPIRAAVGERWTIVTDDVISDGFGSRLGALVRPYRRPVIVAEGLLGYLAADQRDRLVAAVGGALRQSQGAFVCDLHTTQAQAEVSRAARALRLAIAAVTGRRRALDPYPSREAVAESFASGGLPDVAFVEVSDHLGRDTRLEHLSSPAHVVRAKPRS